MTFFIDAFRPVQLLNKALGLQKSSIRPVEDIIETVTIRLHQQLSGLSLVGRIYQHRCLIGIPIVRVVGRELEIPFELSCIGVQRDDAIGVEIIASAAASVEIWPGVAGWPIDQVQCGIE